MSKGFSSIRFGTFLIMIIATTIITSCKRQRSSPDTIADNEIDTVSAGSDWITLFDGKNLNSWHSYGKETAGNAWKIEDSILHLKVDAKSGWKTAGGGDLVTNETFSNFDLKLDWKISGGGNSGIFFYVHEDPSEFVDPNETGLEMQVNDDANANGKIEKHRAGDLYNLISSSSPNLTKPAGEWNHAEVKADRGKLDFYMNGQHILSTRLWDESWENMLENSKFKDLENYGVYKKGKIALQDHGQEVWFKNVMIKKL